MKTAPHVYNVPVNLDMMEYIERQTWELIKARRASGDTGTVSLAEFGRRRIFPRNWKTQLDEMRKTQKDFQRTWAGRKRGKDGANTNGNSGVNTALPKRRT